jgi:hypothetical protein
MENSVKPDEECKSGNVTSVFEKTLEVKLDHDTGEVIGWDHFFAMIEKQNKFRDLNHLEEAKKI